MSNRTPKPRLHPIMAKRAQLVKEAHAHLSANVPAYQAAANASQRMTMIQDHVRTRMRGRGRSDNQ